MIDVATLQGWIEKLGYDTAPDGASMLRLTAREGAPLPSFFVQCTENWVLLSILGLLSADEFRADDLGRRLLAANREMRVAKFAIDENGEIVLCAELPTESLDFSELADAVSRLAATARRFRGDFLGG
ncbi:MAG: CesT family type III secretion system chaperone [Byssovorax sp.]